MFPSVRWFKTSWMGAGTLNVLVFFSPSSPEELYYKAILKRNSALIVRQKCTPTSRVSWVNSTGLLSETEINCFRQPLSHRRRYVGGRQWSGLEEQESQELNGIFWASRECLGRVLPSRGEMPLVLTKVVFSSDRRCAVGRCGSSLGFCTVSSPPFLQRRLPRWLRW